MDCHASVFHVQLRQKTTLEIDNNKTVRSCVLEGVMAPRIHTENNEATMKEELGFLNTHTAT